MYLIMRYMRTLHSKASKGNTLLYINVFSVSVLNIRYNNAWPSRHHDCFSQASLKIEYQYLHRGDLHVACINMHVLKISWVERKRNRMVLHGKE